MLIAAVTSVLAAWLLLSVIVALAVGRAARIAEGVYQDQVFLRSAIDGSATSASARRLGAARR